MNNRRNKLTENVYYLKVKLTEFERRYCGLNSLLYSGYRVFPGGKERPGRDADPSPPSIAVVMKE